jgi:tetratricopeptide (TPR) repeat protein
LALAAVVVIGLGVPAPQLAHAEDAATKEAKEHFFKGEKLFALGRFEAARDEYEAAFEAKPLPEFLYNIGQCHRNLGDFESAIFSFRKYIKLKPDADNRDAVEELIDELQDELDEAERDAKQRRDDEITGRQPPERDTKARPIYKKWWFWTGIVVAGAAATTATILVTSPGSAVPSSDLGNVDFAK